MEIVKENKEMVNLEVGGGLADELCFFFFRCELIVKN